MARRHLIRYDPELKARSRELRAEGTLGEVLLWRRLRRKQLCGYAFYRQRPLADYVVDFYCPELTLAIEVDGATHAFRAEADLTRQARLESLGVQVVRISERAVRFDIAAVMFTLERAVQERAIERNRGV